MKTIIILGGKGGIGKALTEILSRDYKVIPMSSQECDITGYSNIVRSGVDYVINCACFNYDHVIHKTTDFHIRKMIEVNCFGAVNVIREYVNMFREQKKPGKIILMSSFLAERPQKGAGIYCASKAFIDQITRVAALENAHKDITINSIQCGFFQSENGLTERLSDEVKQKVIEKIPIGRFGRVEELAQVIRLIFDCDYITGTNLVIDGGMSLL